MKRRDFYAEYYGRTDRAFADRTIWGAKEREAARRKGQRLTSKFERKVFIVTQYLTLLSCFIPICFHRAAWVVVPVALFGLQAVLTDFSFLKIELLYAVYRKDTVYRSVLHDLFLGKFSDFLNELQRATKKEVTGYVFQSGGKFYGKYIAVCRSKNKKVVLKFQRNAVVVTANEKTAAIRDASLTKEQLLSEIAAIVNEKG